MVFKFIWGVHGLPTCQTVTAEAVELWADRALTDFARKVGKNAPAKQKDWDWKIGSFKNV